MTHPFHTGRYGGATTIPRTHGVATPGAAMVLHHTRPIPIDPMFRALDDPSRRGIAEVRLVPVQVVDFYARTNALPDVRPLGSEEHGAEHASGGVGGVRSRAALAVPTAGGGLQQVQGSAGRDGSGAPAVEGAL